MTVRITLLFALALLSGSLSSAEPMPGTHRIGYLNPGSASLTPIRLEPLRQACESSAMSRVATWYWSPDGARGISSGSVRWRPS